MKKISVIVPVYNVSKYLEICLDSILNQTYTNLEIICVNDGSTDGSLNILKKYAKKDERIKIINKKNGGLSSARNAGLEVATGDYVSFVDSDDWIDKEMLFKLSKSMEENNTDITICAVRCYDEKNREYNDTNPYFTLGFFDKSFDNKVFSYKDTKTFIMDVCVMAWNKLYRKSFLDKCGAKFPHGLIFEDGPFFFSVYFKTKRVSIVRDLLYYYRINRKGSIVEKGGKNFIDIINVVELMYNSLKDVDCFDEVKNEFYCRKADDIVYRYQLVGLMSKYKFSKEVKKKTFLFDEKVFDFNIIKQKAEMVLRRLIEIRDRSNLYLFYKNKYRIKLMYKLMEILYTEDGIYYIKFKTFKRRIKKRVEICNVWYQNDRIYVELFRKIKFNFNFEYSKLEQN